MPTHDTDRYSGWLFWSSPVLSGIGITILLLAEDHSPSTFEFIGLVAVVILPPAAVGVNARRRGLALGRVGVLVVKNVLVMVVVCALALIIGISIGYPTS